MAAVNADKCSDFKPESHEYIPDLELPTLALSFSVIPVLFNQQHEGGKKKDLWGITGRRMFHLELLQRQRTKSIIFPEAPPEKHTFAFLAKEAPERHICLNMV